VEEEEIMKKFLTTAVLLTNMIGFTAALANDVTVYSLHKSQTDIMLTEDNIDDLINNDSSHSKKHGSQKHAKRIQLTDCKPKIDRTKPGNAFICGYVSDATMLPCNLEPECI